MKPVRIAVVGCGHMGSLHAQKLAQLPQANLVAVVDPDPLARQRVAAKCGAPPVSDFRHLFLEPLEAAVIAVPTALHYRVTSEFLARGIHVLVEKPLTPDADSAAGLVDLARRKGAVLQVGHIERFNPAFEFVSARCKRPLWLQSFRYGKLIPRNIHVDVVTDLLVHDLDLISHLVDDTVKVVDAVGWSLSGETIDFAQVHLSFSRGTVAVCTASRISGNLQRRMEVLEEDRLFEIDFAARRLVTREKAPGLPKQTPEVTVRSSSHPANSADDLLQAYFPEKIREFPEADPLTAELVDFLGAIRESRSPRVDGLQALKVVTLAEAIRKRIAEQIAGAQKTVVPESTVATPTSWLAGPHWDRLAKSGRNFPPASPSSRSGSPSE